MAAQLDGWDLIGRLAAAKAQLGACESTALLAAKLLVRTQLTQGVRTPSDILGLAAIIGTDVLIGVIEEMASYEVLRLFNAMWPSAARAELTTVQAARGQLVAILVGDDAATSPPKPVVRTLRRHLALGARRTRPGGDRLGKME